MIIKGKIHVKAIYTCLTVCMDETKMTSLPKAVIISPSVGYLEPVTSLTKLPVEIVNLLQQAVTIPAKARICDSYSPDDVVTPDQLMYQVYLTQCPGVILPFWITLRTSKKSSKRGGERST